MEKILVKYNKSQGKDPITEVIPGCVTRTWIDVSRDVRKEVLLMEDGSLKTDIPELAAWKDIISIHFLGHAIAGLSSNGSIRFYVANQRMQYKNNKEEWAEIWESLLAVDNVKQLIVWGSPYGTSRSGPFAVGLNYNGKLWLAGAMAVIGITSETWSNIERLYDVWGGVLAVRKDRTLLGSGRYSALTGKRIVPEKQSGNDIWYLENNEVAYIPFGQDNAIVLENVSKIIKYSMFDYAYLTCDGTVYSKHFNHFEEDEDSRKIRRNAADILAFGDEGKYFAVLYRNGEVRVFINTHSEDEAYSPLNDTYEFVTNQNYKCFSGDLICENAKSLRFEAGELKAEVNDEIAPEEIIQSSLAINGASIKEAQENASPADSSEWISYEHSNEYQKYYDRIFELIEPEIDRFENASSAYPTKPVNIVRVYTAGLSPVFDIFALTKEGRVLYFKISDLEQESEAKRREVHLRKMSEWRDIVDLAINGNYVSGLRNDGTVVTTSSYDCSKWDDIVQIVMGDWCLAGLRRDGTVIISENRGNNVTMDVKTWRNISSIAAGTCLFGLKSDGRVVRYYDGKLSDNPTEISTLSDISSIAVEDRTLYALTKDKNMITIPQREFAPIDLSQTVRIYNICSFVFAQQSSGRLEILNKDIYYKDDWADACALEKIDDVVFSVMPDGSLKANWYQDKDTRFKGGSIVLNKRLELIDKLKKTKGIARLHFQDGHNLYGEYRGVLAKLKNGSIVTLDDVFNGNTPSTDNAGNEFVIKDQNTIAILNKCSLTFKVRMEKIGEVTFEYEHFTLENVQSAHLYDKDRSLFIKYNDDRYLSVGRVYFSSTSTREPLAYSSMPC